MACTITNTQNDKKHLQHHKPNIIKEYDILGWIIRRFLKPFYHFIFEAILNI